MHIILVGLPGCGKSTVGRQLGRRLGLPFVDSDAVIEQRVEVRDVVEEVVVAAGADPRAVAVARSSTPT